jgi:hypothetical protein
MVAVATQPSVKVVGANGQFRLASNLPVGKCWSRSRSLVFGWFALLPVIPDNEPGCTSRRLWPTSVKCAGLGARQTTG